MKKIKALIKKDVYLIGILGHFLVFGFITFYSFIVTLIFSLLTTLGSLSIFTGISFLMLYLLISMMNKSEANGDASLNSLPLEKEKIVLGRYLSVLMYTVIIPVYIYILSQIIKWNIFLANDRKLSLSVILVAITVLTIFNSVHLLIYYGKEGNSKIIELIPIVVMVGIIILGFRYFEHIQSIQILKYLESFNIVLLLLFIFSIILYGLSFNFSKKMYRKKEF